MRFIVAERIGELEFIFLSSDIKNEDARIRQILQQSLSRANRQDRSNWTRHKSLSNQRDPDGYSIHKACSIASALNGTSMTICP